VFSIFLKYKQNAFNYFLILNKSEAFKIRKRNKTNITKEGHLNYFLILIKGQALKIRKKPLKHS